MMEVSAPLNKEKRVLNKDTKPWNGGYSLTGKRKCRMAISIFGTAFLVFFGVGFLMFRPHGIRGVLWLALGVIAMLAVSIALGEAGSFLGRKLREWTERMERASSALGAKGDAQTQYDLGYFYNHGEGVPQDDTHQGVRPTVVEDYSLDRILQRARAASPTGEVSPATRKRLETLSHELEEVNNKLEEHQEKQAWKEAQRAVDRIKEEVASQERKAGRKRTQAELDAEFDGLVKDLDKLLAGRKSPEEEELAQKREELELLQNQLAERELFLANLRAELAAFEGRYLREVGVLYAELDDWSAKIAESVAQQEGTEEARAAATQARSQAEESHAAAHGEAAEPGEFSPSPELKSLYREAAKLVHPDLATDDADRQRRELLMKEANRAYQEGDADALRRIIEEYESSPESVKGAGVGADLVRVIRQIKQVRVRLAQIELEIASLTESEIAKLKAKAEEASKQGRDLLAEMAENVKRRVEAARGRYESRSMSATP
jgi:hypothetical protein